MPITKFSFEDKPRGWTLNEVSFGDFNLLVGGSGTGKTKILQSLQIVCQVGIDSTTKISGGSWMLELTAGGDLYQWFASTSSETKSPSFTSEKIIKNDRQTLVQRDDQLFEFNGNVLPKLNKTESAVSLLKEEPLLAPLHRVLSHFIFSDEWLGALFLDDLLPFTSIGRSLLAGPFPNLSKEIDKWLAITSSLEALRESVDKPLIFKAYALQKLSPDIFQRIKDDYIEIFPSVLDVKIGLVGELAPELAKQQPHHADSYVLGIREEGVQGWILGKQISAGMLRSLVHLFEMVLAPSGTTIVVDEFENSLGVNCLPQITEHFLRRSDLQFILTSHHPYVINNVPWKYWKLVTRKGSEVTVKDMTAIPSFDSESLLSRFVLLTNLEEYQEAIH